jgi:BirA family transcriptional regulator, biotin operon repressor / biotin---[acetyl-CoA-carboxylase] ligase
VSARALGFGRARHALGEVVSTQQEMARLAAAGAEEGTVVTAEHQTRGRGRRGRVWADVPGESLLVSILLRPAVPMSRAPQLTLVAAVAVVEAFEASAGVAPGIRWPNDVLVGGRKICGILAEAVAGADGRLQHVILGIGANVNQAEFPDDLRAIATSLRVEAGRVVAREAVLDAILESLDRRYAEFLAGGFAALREVWRSRSVTLGRPVRGPDGREAIAVDVDEEGALIARDADGSLLRFTSGDVGGAT